MTLSFPNPSRSYNKARHSICFSGYDGAFEILFRVEVTALPVTENRCLNLTEDDWLTAFDRSRKSIREVASKAYSHGRKEVYLLKAADFK